MPPRSLFVDAPLGHTAGPKHEPEIGRGIIEMALGLFDLALPSGSITDSGYRWPNDDWRADPLGWSRRREDGATTAAAKPADAKADTRTERSDEPQYQHPADREAAERH